jgi:hypothetical protein
MRDRQVPAFPGFSGNTSISSPQSGAAHQGYDKTLAQAATPSARFFAEALKGLSSQSCISRRHSTTHIDSPIAMAAARLSLKTARHERHLMNARGGAGRRDNARRRSPKLTGILQCGHKGGPRSDMFSTRPDRGAGEC